MSTRRSRSRNILALESLEIRTAPSHISPLAHAVVHIQHIKPAVHVEKVHDTHVKETIQSVETKTGTDPSSDTGTGSTSIDTSPHDTTSKDPNAQS
jgi:hypothetical protein